MRNSQVFSACVAVMCLLSCRSSPTLLFSSKDVAVDVGGRALSFGGARPVVFGFSLFGDMYKAPDVARAVTARRPCAGDASWGGYADALAACGRLEDSVLAVMPGLIVLDSVRLDGDESVVEPLVGSDALLRLPASADAADISLRRKVFADQGVGRVVVRDVLKSVSIVYVFQNHSTPPPPGGAISGLYQPFRIKMRAVGDLTAGTLPAVITDRADRISLAFALAGY